MFFLWLVCAGDRHVDLHLHMMVQCASCGYFSGLMCGPEQAEHSVYMYECEHAHTCAHEPSAYGCQRTTWGLCFCLYNHCPGNLTQVSGLVAGAFAYRASSPTHWNNTTEQQDVGVFFVMFHIVVPFSTPEHGLTDLMSAPSKPIHLWGRLWNIL